ncbi:Prophage PSPPH06, virion morphogenesis protein [Moritella viscosa]|uniref:phage virion morphogenesis protein n=1 Tax=Moritella viscosa TaxID=80854 RepID=UPI000508E486|nr:phage virion morphogenesis protein [Moritella viscosa]CED59256.1 putative tail completion protein [Moritella viscosa]CED59974.1 phage virion morphogenesis protein,Phage virion morphogenesis family [Moritella viscosa]SHO00720.1 Prophage PSPPH06, virion morphogenesis protein [Moritella viscosa]SHO20337.1 Prophage PSPPH06, virion morphogenesis protein [Moritella viscosa]
MLNLGIPTDNALKQLDLLTLDANKRRRILRGAGRQVRRDTKARLKGQQNLSGTYWQGRANGKKTRMLKKLGKGLQVHTTANNATVTFGDPHAGKIARVHQEGIDVTVKAKTATELQQQRGTLDYSDPSTRKQAKALRKEGYKIRQKRGKGWKTPTLKWMQENLTMGRAGLILRLMRENAPKSSWEIKTPARSFLGQNETEQTQLKNYMLDEAFRLR